jgi:hypothetical protein
VKVKSQKKQADLVSVKSSVKSARDVKLKTIEYEDKKSNASKHEALLSFISPRVASKQEQRLASESIS